MEALKDVQICDHGQSDGDCAGCRTASLKHSLEPVQTGSKVASLNSEPDIRAMTDRELADFWDNIDSRQRMMNELLGGYKMAAKSELERRITERRKLNPRAIAIAHPSLKIRMEDQFSKYQFKEEMLPKVKAVLAPDEFAKIAMFVAAVTPDPIPEHWEIKSTASTTIKSLMDVYDGTAEGELLKEFMTRERTGAGLVIDRREPDKHAQSLETPVQRTPIGGA